MYPPSIQKLIELFSKFPTVGPRTASRFVFYLLNLTNERTEELLKSISDLKKQVKLCSSCFNPFDPAQGKYSENEVCGICSNPGRDKSLLCVVEKETDLETIEKTKKYKGLYFVLGGTVSKLRKEDVEKLRTKELEEKLKKTVEIKEIILALNSTAEGEATGLYLERLIKSLDTARDKKTSRLGRGLPLGSELEYADDETLSSALNNRR